MTDMKCKVCKKQIEILWDKYYRITVEYDTPTYETKTVMRAHKACWESIPLILEDEK